MQRPEQQLTGHCVSRLSDRREPRGGAGLRQGWAVERRRAASGGPGSLREQADRVSAPLRALLPSESDPPDTNAASKRRVGRLCSRDARVAAAGLIFPHFMSQDHEQECHWQGENSGPDTARQEGRKAKAAPICLGEKALIPLIQQLANLGIYRH